ncbi:MAG: hypothetical protein V1891_02070 [bacterium]
MKNRQHKEFNIPIKIFGANQKKNKSLDSVANNIKYSEEQQNNEIIPVILDPEIYDNAKNTNAKDKLANKKKCVLTSPIKWIEKKTKKERLNLMWAIVGLFMIVIIFVWTIFLKYNILLEKLSLKQTEKEDEWEEIKENFEKSMEEFQKKLSEVKNNEPFKSNETLEIDNADAIKETSNASENIDISQENIKKLKEKLTNTAK